MNPAEQNPRTRVNYADFQRSIDKLLGKYGLDHSISILNSFTSNSQIAPTASQKLKLVREYIMAITIEEFDLEPAQFLTSDIREYREARSVCYHVLNIVPELSHGKIAEAFNRKRGHVFYFIHECKNRLELPHVYRGFFARHRAVLERTSQFISKL